MSFFRKVRQAFQNKPREEFCAHLQSLGIDASLAERGRDEEKIGGGNSLGIIDIADGPIRWVNVLIEHGEETSWCNIEYSVPDPKIEGLPEMRIESIRVKTFPIFGGVIDLLWKGEDSGLGIISRLNGDTSIKHPIMTSMHPTGLLQVKLGLDLRIRAYRENLCWILSPSTGDVPSREVWGCYQAIARHLLA